MTEGEKAFYKLRMREEVRLSERSENSEIRELHLRWVKFYVDRLDGGKSPPPYPQSPYEELRHSITEYTTEALGSLVAVLRAAIREPASAMREGNRAFR